MDGSIFAVQELLADGSLTSEKLVLGSLDRIRRFDSALGSVLELNREALAEARATDARRRAGSVIGGLAPGPASRGLARSGAAPRSHTVDWWMGVHTAIPSWLLPSPSATSRAHV